MEDNRSWGLGRGQTWGALNPLLKCSFSDDRGRTDSSPGTLEHKGLVKFPRLSPATRQSDLQKIPLSLDATASHVSTPDNCSRQLQKTPFFPSDPRTTSPVTTWDLEDSQALPLPQSENWVEKKKEVSWVEIPTAPPLSSLLTPNLTLPLYLIAWIPDKAPGMSCPRVPVEDLNVAGFQPYQLHPLSPRLHLLPSQTSPTSSHPDLPDPGVWFNPQQMTNILRVKWVCWEGAGPLESRQAHQLGNSQTGPLCSP